MTTAVTPTIEELVWCKPEVWAVPFFDGTCREYSTINQTAQEVLECMIGEDLGIIWHSITVSPTNDLSVVSTIDQLLASSLVWTVLTIGQNFVFDLWTLLNTSYYITDWSNNYEIKNHENLRWRGADWIHFNVGGWDIEIGLPTPVAQYFTPGRCTPGPLLAYRSWRIAGMSTAVTITADNTWADGNLITLVFWAGDTLADAILAWNTANPANTATLTSWIDTQEPGDGEYIQLHHWADANTCQETDYMPNNKWLVLTRDCVTNQAQRLPIQCCPQTLGFNGEWLTINVACDCSLEVLYGINTDNQQLSLNGNDLCLDARHGGTLGNQIPDLPSCVDLIDVAKKYLSIDWYRVTISWGNSINLWAIGHLNCVDILNCICDNKIDRVAEWVLMMPSATDFPLPPIWPDDWNIATAYNEQDTVVWNWRNRLAIADTVAGQEPGLSPSVWLQTYTPTPLSPWVITAADRGQVPAWTAQHYNDNSLVIHGWKRRVAITDAAAWDEPGLAPAVWWQISASLYPNDAWQTFFSQPRSMCEMRAFIAPKVWLHLTIPPEVDHCTECGWDIITCNDCYDNYEWDYDYDYRNDVDSHDCYNCNNITNVWNVIVKQKYPAKIYVSDNNRTGWSQNTYPHGVDDPDNNNAARWLIPTFDQGLGRRSVDTEMVSRDGRHIWADPARLKIYNGATLVLNRALWLWYDPISWPSDNNPTTQVESEFAQEAVGQVNKSALCIYIPKTGRYNVEMTWVCQADHNVHAFRMSTLRYRPGVPADEELQLLMDSKFGWGNSGSASMNNVLVPATSQYQMNASKLFLLQKWDVLFVGMKIDPRTIWPKYQGETVNLPTPPGWTATARDVIYWLNDQAPAYWVYNHTAASWSYVTPDTSSVTRNYSVLTWWYNIGTDEFSWMPASLPNVSPHRFWPTTTWTVHSGAEFYGLNLVYPGWWALSSDYRRDDGVVILYGPSSWFNSDGEWTALTYEAWWATLSVFYVASAQGDDADI